MLGIYSIGEQSRLDGAGLHQLCPVMLQQLDAGTCRTHEEEQGGDASPRPSDTEGQHWAPDVGQKCSQCGLNRCDGDLFGLKVGMLFDSSDEVGLESGKA